MPFITGRDGMGMRGPWHLGRLTFSSAYHLQRCGAGGGAVRGGLTISPRTRLSPGLME